MTIQTVKTKKDLQDFIDVPNIINRNNSNWIAPLQMSVRDVFSTKNPFWSFCKKELFVAYQDGKPIGRIAAFYNQKLNELHQNNEGNFGYLEAINDSKIFEALINVAEKWLQQFNCQSISGPFNPGLNYELGTLVQGFEYPPSFMMSYNPAYYDKQIQHCGFQKDIDFFAYHLNVADFVSYDKMLRVNQYLKNKLKINFRTVNLKNFQQESSIIHEIYNDAFRGHYGYVPFEKDEFAYMAKDMTQIIDERLLFILEINGEPAGFILALPNLNDALKHVKNGKLFPFGFLKFLWYKPKVRTVRVINLAIKHKFQHLGLGSLFYEEIINRLKSANYTGGEISWVVENNFPMTQAAQFLGAKIAKTYRIYKKQIIQNS